MWSSPRLSGSSADTLGSRVLVYVYVRTRAPEAVPDAVNYALSTYAPHTSKRPSTFLWASGSGKLPPPPPLCVYPQE